MYGPLLESHPTAFKVWMSVVNELVDLQDRLLKLQELKRAHRQAEQQKLGVRPMLLHAVALLSASCPTDACSRMFQVAQAF